MTPKWPLYDIWMTFGWPLNEALKTLNDPTMTLKWPSNNPKWQLNNSWITLRWSSNYMHMTWMTLKWHHMNLNDHQMTPKWPSNDSMMIFLLIFFSSFFRFRFSISISDSHISDLRFAFRFSDLPSHFLHLWLEFSDLPILTSSFDAWRIFRFSQTCFFDYSLNFQYFFTRIGAKDPALKHIPTHTQFPNSISSSRIN